MPKIPIHYGQPKHQWPRHASCNTEHHELEADDSEKFLDIAIAILKIKIQIADLGN